MLVFLVSIVWLFFLFVVVCHMLLIAFGRCVLLVFVFLGVFSRRWLSCFLFEWKNSLPGTGKVQRELRHQLSDEIEERVDGIYACSVQRIPNPAAS